jgi:hypothetical protein
MSRRKFALGAVCLVTFVTALMAGGLDKNDFAMLDHDNVQRHLEDILRKLDFLERDRAQQRLAAQLPAATPPVGVRESREDNALGSPPKVAPAPAPKDGWQWHPQGYWYRTVPAPSYQAPVYAAPQPVYAQPIYGQPAPVLRGVTINAGFGAVRGCSGGG